MIRPRRSGPERQRRRSTIAAAAASLPASAPLRAAANGRRHRDGRSRSRLGRRAAARSCGWPRPRAAPRCCRPEQSSQRPAGAAAPRGCRRAARPLSMAPAGARLGPPTPADWAALARDLSGPLVRPGESRLRHGQGTFDPRFDSLRPAGIAYCRNPHDVSTCLAFARRYRVPVAARCGGHSYAGWSSTSGLIVDVTRMAGVSVSGSTATVGAGTRLIDFYNGLAAHGRAVPGGSCPTVGISGLTLGGGIGVVGRAYGLTCDNVKSMQIVTADGQVARPARAPTPTCSGPAAAVAAGTSAWSPRSPSPPTRPGTSSCSSCPGRGRRRPGSSRPGSPGRRTPRTSSGRTCTWPRRPAACADDPGRRHLPGFGERCHAPAGQAVRRGRLGPVLPFLE